MPAPKSDLGQHGPCPVCGGHMGGRVRGDAVTCSPRCASNATSARYRAKRPARAGGIHGPCPVCGEHMGTRRNANATACSPRCVDAATRDHRRLGERRFLFVRSTCGICGSSLSVAQVKRSFCSKECRATSKSVLLAARTHGIPYEEARRLRLQERCDVCGSRGKTTSAGRRLAIDHCHETGAVRGVLCDACNWALGGVRDSPFRLVKLAEYLVTRGAKPVDINPWETPTIRTIFLQSTKERVA